MKKISLIFLILLLSPFFNSSYAIEVTVFGPEKYIKVEEEPTLGEAEQEATDDVPTIYTDSFLGVEGTGCSASKESGQI